MAIRAKGVNAAHTAGIFADMTLDGPEIGTLVAVIDRAKNLPNRKTMGKQDPYCAMRLGKEAKKTDTDRRGGQTPRWDQELRFTVHDAPDYYKLKCSIFNDDKKTDLISETWIDLQSVIVPGGGQSDCWRQLNFKGKYAGDIRVELTYYDTRPKPETPVEARRQRDKSHSLVTDATNTASGSRQLGPREIKRRPLPPGPAGYSSPVSAPMTPENWPVDEEDFEPLPSRGYSNSNPPPRPPKQHFIPETPDDVGYDLNPRFGPDSYEPQYDSSDPYQQRFASNEYQHHSNSSVEPFSEPDTFTEDPHQTRSSPAQPQRSEYMQEKEQHFPTGSYSPYDLSDHHSTPRTTPQSTPPATAQGQQWNGRTSTSPIKYSSYRDSPLRQSISQTEMPQPAQDYFAPDPRFEQDEPPPPPPSHQGQFSRVAPAQRQQNTSDVPASAPRGHSYGPPSPRTPVKFQAIEDRSPLQRIEHEYDPFQATPPPMQSHSPRPRSKAPSPDHDRYPMFPLEKRKSNTPEASNNRPTSSSGDVALPEHHYNQGPAQRSYHESPRDDFRHSTGYPPPRRAQTFDSFEVHDDRHIRRSDPILVRPRAISPNPNHIIPRKSITPTPGTPNDPRSISASPFGPDSYDVLNTATSPTPDSGAYKSPEAGMEAARQKEVEKIRDQGPIIGNDGRVIDPSDHLPADTWAPEPEKKQRRPEHVVKIRTREEARQHRSTGSSPASARPQPMSASPYQTPTPGYVSSPFKTPPVAEMPESPSAESPGSRHRLRKPMPQRPLHTQPYANSSPAVPTLPAINPRLQRPLPTQPYANSSPAVPTLPAVEPRPTPASQGYTTHSSPAGGLPQRQSFSEYQVPTVNDYSPRGSAPPVLDYRQDYQRHTPTRSPMDRQPMDYGGGSPYGGDDPLALELSRIDLGPSRAGRTTLRPQRTYGAY